MLINRHSCSKLLSLMVLLCLAFDLRPVSAMKCRLGFVKRGGQCTWP
uniref:ACP54A1 n=1 Tax=Drosophila melanogaster TaxID=7227 RepID=Q45WH6_DROME|nr:ACP54A1 [Drosophila melanogaster]